MVLFSNQLLLLPSMMSEDLFNIKYDAVGDCDSKNEEKQQFNCCFRGQAGDWSSDDNFTPKLMDNVQNLRNNGCGVNPYDAPTHF